MSSFYPAGQSTWNRSTFGGCWFGPFSFYRDTQVRFHVDWWEDMSFFERPLFSWFYMGTKGQPNFLGDPPPIQETHLDPNLVWTERRCSFSPKRIPNPVAVKTGPVQRSVPFYYPFNFNLKQHRLASRMSMRITTPPQSDKESRIHARD